MIPLRQSVYRNLTRINLAKVRAQGVVITRFQSVSVGNSNDRTKPVERKRAPLNPKLRDVANQIREVVKNATNDLSESVEILEEGLLYLREIQVSEKIPERVLYHEFQAVVTNLLYKAISTETSTSPNQILDVLVQYKVAHKYHFTLVAANWMKASAYHEVLKLWVQNVEYEKSMDFYYSNPYVIKESGIDFKGYYLVNLAYFSFVQSCIQEGVKYLAEDASKLLQSEPPAPFFVRGTLADLHLLSSHTKEFQAFTKTVQSHAYDNLDPNGPIAYKKINSAADRKDPSGLNRVFVELQEAAKKSSKPLTEGTMNRVMKAYLDCDRPEDIFNLFQSMLQHGIEVPSISSWELVLRAMGHPSHVSKRTTKRKTIAENIDRTIETIVSNGTEITPKTLSIIVGAFANLNRFDKVEEYLQRFSTEGEGSLKIINPTKNNILVGLVLNNKVGEAETKLKQFMADGSGYVPITHTMNTFLGHYAKTKNYKAVEGILEFMKKNNIPEEVATYTIMIDIFFKLHREKGLAPDVDQILASITKSNTIQLNDFTYTALIDGLVKDGANIEAARQIFAGASKKYKLSAQLYTSMMKGELDFGSVANAEVIFDKYIKHISNDARVWNMMITSLLAKHEDLALQYYENMKAQASLKVEPNFFTYYYLLSHFLKRGNKERVQYLIDELLGQKLRDLGSELPKILHPLTSEYSFSNELLGQLKQQ
ncbi:uncharacterized protein CANTADRAFT_44564 [Suhomyces tanzawaensis NRRL Y-17324]|uniref:Mitochondrial 15S rRNA processing factor CCM1 n=1 Tax=Suhomyces tanzawaensis NRRL Y-17324 TaxID=984487 RepID=A0A1E4SQ33_9ASCO|nr:uncharacterized protein CANTADRAFT_44564 [Suhomyces tanzawaensis NRRL Y-17324]ODV81605.1 hypothetical protein CANTADRAFT_44564 [Suhomyces tanzawaensis NRRL Y-17324]